MFVYIERFYNLVCFDYRNIHVKNLTISVTNGKEKELLFLMDYDKIQTKW